MNARRFALPALCALLLGACGQTGPLYFDEAPPADQLPPSLKRSATPALPVPAARASETAPAHAADEAAPAAEVDASATVEQKN